MYQCIDAVDGVKHECYRGFIAIWWFGCEFTGESKVNGVAFEANLLEPTDGFSSSV